MKFVAIYLRKSREEEADELKYHRLVLEELCKKQKWIYVIYSEVATGDTIQGRPKMQELLSDVKDERYDAVLTYDYDRLGRGRRTDTGLIFSILQNSDTFLICANPLQVYDLNKDSDEQILDFHAFLARWEYKQITRRMKAGKKIRAKMGQWVFGAAPYGYDYDRNSNSLVVNKTEKEILREMVNSLVAGASVTSIVRELNKRNVASPRGVKWNGNTIRRLMRSQIYLGHTVYNKSEGNRYFVENSSSKPFRDLPESKWEVVKNTHEAIITEDEFQKIVNKFKKVPKKEFYKTIHPYSNLVKCGLCQRNMVNRLDKNKKVILRACPCGNRGGGTECIKDAIYQATSIYKVELESMLKDKERKAKEDALKQNIILLTETISELDKEIIRVETTFEEGLYSIVEFKKLLANSEKLKSEKESEKAEIEKELNLIQKENFSEKLQTIETYFRSIEKEKKSAEINKIYKTFIKEVVFTKNKNEIDIKINFFND